MYTLSFSGTYEEGAYSFLPVDLVASHINCPMKSRKCVIVDVRPHRDFVENHIKGAVHLHLNAMQLRRLTKGVSELETIIADERCKEVLRRRHCSDVQLVLYDDSSSEGKLLTDIKNYITILQKGMKGSLCMLNGGFQAFRSSYPSLCQVARRVGNHPRVKPPTLSLTGSPKTAPCLREDLFLSPQLPTLPPTQILPHLYLGMARDSSNLPSLEDLGITAILNVSSSCPIHFDKVFKYKRISVEDAYDEDLLSTFKDAAAFIESVKAEGGRVLVHCFAGISRSATICIAYLMLTEDFSMHQALEYTRSRRPCVSPNFNFMGQLLSFEHQLKKERIAKVTDTCLVGSVAEDSCLLPIEEPMEINRCCDVVCDVVDLNNEVCMEDPPSVFPKKRPGSLPFTGIAASRSAENSPSKRRPAHGLCLDISRRQQSLCTTTGLSSSDTMLHCSSPIELNALQPTATRA